MELNSWAFLIFAAAAIVVARLVNNVILRKWALLATSAAFLSGYIADLRSAVVLAGFVLVSYALGRPRLRTAIHWSGPLAAATITLLWTFLFLVKDPHLLGSANPFHANPVAIVGISYLVFRAISYLMEVETLEKTTLLDYLNYMLFFPTILSGPIERFKTFAPTYGTAATGSGDILYGLHRIANGFIKKFVLADNLAVYSIARIVNPAETPPAMLWFSALIQLLLIYLDFSGYCDIAIGVASLMGIKIRENFNRPFASTNIQEFWERWHVTMSSLMRDYIFAPITKVIYTRAPSAWHWPLIVAAYCFLMMLIALWHGTTTGFLVFGLTHGIVLVAIQIRQRLRRGKKKAPMSAASRALWMGITYLFISFTMVMWMAPGDHWWLYYKAMFGGR